MGLRLAEGVNLERLATLTGLRPNATSIRALADLGLIARGGADEGRLRVTAAGRMVLNNIVLRLSESLEPTPPRSSPADHAQVAD